jgi:hypothetical protein
MLIKALHRPFNCFKLLRQYFLKRYLVNGMGYDQNRGLRVLNLFAKINDAT